MYKACMGRTDIDILVNKLQKVVNQLSVEEECFGFSRNAVLKATSCTT